nr:Stf0 family sulfotransferase [Caulobacter sp. 17J65-9]
MRGYAVCAAPRAGTNLLCQVLASTGVLGRPLEYFNGPGRRSWDIPDYPDEPRRQLEAVVRHGRTPNGIYGLKLFAFQSDALGLPWASVLPELRFVHLRRRDLLGQALSWARAHQTGAFRADAADVRTPAYDADLIADCLRRVVVEEARWRLFFARNGAAALELSYEDVVAAPEAAVRAVARLVGLTEAPAHDAAKVSVRVQRDDLSEAWRERFLRDRGDLGFVDAF